MLRKSIEMDLLIVSLGKQGTAFLVPSRSLTYTIIIGSDGAAGGGFFSFFFSFTSFSSDFGGLGSATAFEGRSLRPSVCGDRDLDRGRGL